MKKIALYILAAAAIFAGCSKKNIDTTPVNAEDAWMYDATLPVPIQFSAGNSSLTKAALIESVGDMIGKKFGFFATNGNIDDWSKSNLLDMPQNAVATVSASDINGDLVRFKFDDGTYYYDQTSWDPYTFYAYHAQVSGRDEFGQTITQHSDSILVRADIGRTDILWGCAKAETLYDGEVSYEGFNARYIRNSSRLTGKTIQPTIKFKHMTACVQFRAKTLAPEYAENFADADELKIVSMYVDDAIVKHSLCIAHKTQPEKQGTFAKLKNVNLPAKGDLYVSTDDEGANTALNVVLNETAAEVGKPLFIHPGDEIKIVVEYQTNVNGTVKNFTSAYTLKPTVENGSVVNGFKAGYRYNYTLVVYSPERVVIEAQVDKYTSAFGEDVWVDVAPDNE